MTGFASSICTLAAFGLIGWGIYYAIGRLATDYAAFRNAMQREVTSLHSQDKSL